MATQIFNIGVPDSSTKVSSTRPNTLGQWTSITAKCVETGGNGGTQGDVTISRGPDGSLTRSVTGSRVGLSAASQIVAAVALPMPNNVQFAYGADWTVDETSLLERNASTAINGQDLSQSGGFFDGLKDQVAKMGASTAFRKALKDKGRAHDPHKEMFYNSPQFRSFPFQWDISFVSKSEADQFERMVEVMLRRMHPEYQKDALAGTWQIPDSFAIEFVNAKTRKIKDCVLTNLTVDYASSGAGWRAFHDGTPAHVSLSMSFLEVTPLLRQDIEAGF